MKIYSTVLEMLKRQEQGVLVTVIGGTPPFENLTGMHWIYAKRVIGESEQTPLAEQVIQLVESGEQWTALQRETFGRLENQIFQIAAEGMDKKEFRRVRLVGEKSDIEWVELILEPILPTERLIILGGGHVGQALARMAEFSGFPVVVVDDRPFFTQEELFPGGTQVVCDDFPRAIEQLQPGSTDYVVIVTRGHQYDRNCLKQLAGSRLAYVGMIGSKRRVSGLFEEMGKEGVSVEWLEKVHSPIGLDIGAETPEEIAVSILAEIIRVKRKGA